jgi:hypothetical protein
MIVPKFDRGEVGKWSELDWRLDVAFEESKLVLKSLETKCLKMNWKDELEK